jgi:hypothetical protein
LHVHCKKIENKIGAMVDFLQIENWCCVHSLVHLKQNENEDLTEIKCFAAVCYVFVGWKRNENQDDVCILLL